MIVMKKGQIVFYLYMLPEEREIDMFSEERIDREERILAHRVEQLGGGK